MYKLIKALLFYSLMTSLIVGMTISGPISTEKTKDGRTETTKVQPVTLMEGASSSGGADFSQQQEDEDAFVKEAEETLLEEAVETVEPDMAQEEADESPEEKLMVILDPASLADIRYELEEDRSPQEGEEISLGFEGPEAYAEVEGITCFRGSPYRNSASFGTPDIRDEKLEIVWKIPIGGIDKWTGVGWNGQPAVVHWPYELQQAMNIVEDKKIKSNLKEVIYAALDGKVYFLDLEDGSYTREPILIPGPVKGSVTVDPRGIPLLYVGQGINTVHGRKVEMGYRIFSLLNQSKLFFINGSDSFAYRRWPAFDSTALIDKNSDTMVIGGENGILYKVRLNTHYEPEQKSLSIRPFVVKYRYKASGNAYQGIENSVAIYNSYAFFADNGGTLQCVDLNTMKPLWVRGVTDDTDSTIVLEEDHEGDALFLYTGCEVDKQGPKGSAYLRKFNALTGETLWEKPYKCDATQGDNPVNGGAFATPIVGEKDMEDLVIYNLSRCGGFNKGRVVALNKESGEEIWSFDLDHYSWSSPVAVYTPQDKGYIILCDTAGNMFLLEGSSGRLLDRVSLGTNVEGSPAVYENMIVVGTRGQRIYGVKIN